MAKDVELKNYVKTIYDAVFVVPRFPVSNTEKDDPDERIRCKMFDIDEYRVKSKYQHPSIDVVDYPDVGESKGVKVKDCRVSEDGIHVVSNYDPVIEKCESETGDEWKPIPHNLLTGSQCGSMVKRGDLEEGKEAPNINFGSFRVFKHHMLQIVVDRAFMVIPDQEISRVKDVVTTSDADEMSQSQLTRLWKFMLGYPNYLNLRAQYMKRFIESIEGDFQRAGKELTDAKKQSMLMDFQRYPLMLQTYVTMPKKGTADYTGIRKAYLVAYPKSGDNFNLFLLVCKFDPYDVERYLYGGMSSEDVDDGAIYVRRFSGMQGYEYGGRRYQPGFFPEELLYRLLDDDPEQADAAGMTPSQQVIEALGLGDIVGDKLHICDRSAIKKALYRRLTYNVTAPVGGREVPMHFLMRRPLKPTEKDEEGNIVSEGRITNFYNKVEDDRLRKGRLVVATSDIIRRVNEEIADDEYDNVGAFAGKFQSIIEDEAPFLGRISDCTESFNVPMKDGVPILSDPVALRGLRILPKRGGTEMVAELIGPDGEVVEAKDEKRNKAVNIKGADHLTDRNMRSNKDSTYEKMKQGFFLRKAYRLVPRDEETFQNWLECVDENFKVIDRAGVNRGYKMGFSTDIVFTRESKAWPAQVTGKRIGDKTSAVVLLLSSSKFNENAGKDFNTDIVDTIPDGYREAQADNRDAGFDLAWYDWPDEDKKWWLHREFFYANRFRMYPSNAPEKDFPDLELEYEEKRASYHVKVNISTNKGGSPGWVSKLTVIYTIPKNPVGSKQGPRRTFCVGSRNHIFVDWEQTSIDKDTDADYSTYYEKVADE